MRKAKPEPVSHKATDAEKRRRWKKAQTSSRICAVVSDLHFAAVCPKTWGAFRAWARVVKPYWIVALGDVVDFASASRYEKKKDDPLHLIDDIDPMIDEFNELRDDCSRLTITIGNHDLRVEKLILGAAPHVLKGLRGLTLPEICKAHGLREDIEWHRESVRTPDLRCSQYILRHGHVGSGSFGGPKFPANNELTKTLGNSSIIGHHHKIGMATATAFGKTTVSIANGCMAAPAEYGGTNANTQTGFTIIEQHYPDYERATAYPVLIESGRFSWGGRTWQAR